MVLLVQLLLECPAYLAVLVGLLVPAVRFLLVDLEFLAVLWHLGLLFLKSDYLGNANIRP